MTDPTITGELGPRRTPRVHVEVGRYVVLGPLGEGATGAVFSAYDEALDRRIALKILTSGSDRSLDDLNARVLAEAQALAKLAHPNVVVVHDAGIADGQAYVAMELVDGNDLGAWLSTEPRTRAAILDAFRQAGRGLAAAHAAGFVHRDFKPANVLVGRDGRVRVVDFGLAANLARDADARRGAGTPAYMAPEQREGAAPTPASDQYSFGIALAEALTGSRDDAATGAPTWLRAIVRRATAESPDDRYATMDDLVAALASDPAQRWRRRAFAGLTVTGLAIAAWGWAAAGARPTPCQGAARHLADVWNDPRRTAAKAAFAAVGSELAPSWLATERLLDTYASKWISTHEDACAATRIRGEQTDDVLGRRMLCLHRARASLDGLADLLAHADRRVAERGVFAASSLPPLDACSDLVALMADVAPPTDPNVEARANDVRSRLAEASVLRLAGRYREGLEIATAAEAAARDLDYPPLLAEALVTLGDLQDYNGQSAASERALFDAWTVAVGSGYDRVAARAAVELVWMVGNAGRRYDEVDRIAALAEAAVHRIGDPPDLRARYLGYLGGMANDRSDPSRAFALLNEALTLVVAAYGPEHPQAEVLLFNLAGTAMVEGRFDEALAFYLRDLEALLPRLGPDHPDIGQVQHAIGNAYVQTDRYTEAAAAYRRAVEIRERALGADHPDLGNSLNGLGEATLGLARYEVLRGDPDATTAHRFDEAQRVLLRSLAIKEATLDPEHPALATTLENLGRLACARGDAKSARAALSRSLAIREKKLGDRHEDVGGTYEALAEVALLEGRLATAEQALIRAEQIAEVLGPSAARLSASIHATRGRLRARQRRFEEASAELATALDDELRLLAPQSPRTLDTLFALAAVAESTKDPSVATRYEARVRERIEDATLLARWTESKAARRLAQ